MHSDADAHRSFNCVSGTLGNPRQDALDDAGRRRGVNGFSNFRAASLRPSRARLGRRSGPRELPR